MSQYAKAMNAAKPVLHLCNVSEVCMADPADQAAPAKKGQYLTSAMVQKRRWRTAARIALSLTVASFMVSAFCSADPAATWWWLVGIVGLNIWTLLRLSEGRRS